MRPTYTAEQWHKIVPALRSLANITIQMAQAVLVDGKRPADVAREMGESRQLVNAAIKRVTDIAGKPHGTGLVPVVVWLPADKAAQVEEMAREYIEEPALLQEKKKVDE